MEYYHEPPPPLPTPPPEDPPLNPEENPDEFLVGAAAERKLAIDESR
jgi:hypothetical protein